VYINLYSEDTPQSVSFHAGQSTTPGAQICSEVQNLSPGAYHIDVIDGTQDRWFVYTYGTGSGDSPGSITVPAMVSQATGVPANGATPLLQESAVGDRVSGPFITPTGDVQICWTVTSTSGDGTNPFAIFRVDSLIDSDTLGVFNVNTTDQDCGAGIGDPGIYSITVYSDATTRWSVTVRSD
jgi:hypothetical protein